MLKGLNKMTLGRKREIIGNINITKIREAQKILCLLYFFFTDIVAYRNSQVLFKKSGKITGGKGGMFRQSLDGNPVIDMGINIVYTL